MANTDKSTGFLRWGMLALFVFFTLGGGTLIGINNIPGDWYSGLEKPFFNPPNWIFGPVWSVLYVIIAVAGWRTWNRGPKGLPMQVWFAQLAANFLWSPSFFGMQQPGLALLVIAVLLVLIVIFIRLTWIPDRLSATLFLPYSAWVGFASLLNFSIWWLN